MSRSSDVKLLHPAFRERLNDVLRDLDDEQVPLEIYEAYRSPERQAELYARGRAPGVGTRKVTRAPAWRSFHDFGLAVDLVLWIDGRWTWGPTGEPGAPGRDQIDGWWNRYHDLARARGLVPLSFEKPHVQLEGVALSDLLAGRYPAGGDDSWEANLEGAIVRWGALPREIYGLPMPGAPPLVDERPEVAELPAGYVYDEDVGVCRPA